MREALKELAFESGDEDDGAHDQRGAQRARELPADTGTAPLQTSAAGNYYAGTPALG